MSQWLDCTNFQHSIAFLSSCLQHFPARPQHRVQHILLEFLCSFVTKQLNCCQIRFSDHNNAWNVEWHSRIVVDVKFLLQIISHRDKPEVTPTKAQKFPFNSFCPQSAAVLYLLSTIHTAQLYTLHLLCSGCLSAVNHNFTFIRFPHQRSPPTTSHTTQIYLYLGCQCCSAAVLQCCSAPHCCTHHHSRRPGMVGTVLKVSMLW